MKPPRAALALLLVAGCGASTPVPPTGPHSPDDQSVVVPYPPPPARVEILVPPPEDLESPVWVDGEWQWRGRRWVWFASRWEPLPRGAYWAPATTVRRADGALVWFAGVWHFPEDSGRAPQAQPAPPAK